MNAAEKHPQRQEIIDAILAGEALRSIAKRVVPPMNHTTLSRFKLQILTPAVSTLRGTSSKYSELQGLALATGMKQTRLDPASAVDLMVKQSVHASIDKRIQRREAWIKSAWNGGTDPDHRALSAHDRNEFTDLELTARLAGLLQTGAPGETTVNIAVMVPAAAEVPEARVIEIGKTR